MELALWLIGVVTGILLYHFCKAGVKSLINDLKRK